MTYNWYNIKSKEKPITQDDLNAEDEDEAYWNESSFKKPSSSAYVRAGSSTKTDPKDSLSESRNRLLANNVSSKPRSGYLDSHAVQDSIRNGNDAANVPGTGRYEQLQQQMQASQQRTVASSQRTLQLVNQTEEVGIETANELARQGEQLNRAEQGLDHINQELNTSKRHITSLKSWFAPVKNYFSSSNDGYPATSSSKSSSSAAGQSNHSNPESQSTVSYGSVGSKPNFELMPESQMRNWSDAMKENEVRCNKNLDEISSGMSRLKMMASGLGSELDRQNEQIDRMNYKTEGNHVKMRKQNQELNSLLR